MTLHYTVIGSGPPLIILHGLFGSLTNWRSVTAVLAEKCKVFAVDQRNHGRSPHAEIHTYPLLAGDILEFMTEHRIEHPTVIGHSMGGKAGMFLATMHPGRIGALIVVDVAPRPYASHHADLFDALCEVSLERAVGRQTVEDQLRLRIPDERVRRFLMTNLRKKHDGGLEWRMNLAGLRANHAEIGKGLQTGKTYPGPTLFIRGASSNHIDENDFFMIRKTFPIARIVTIPQAGHWVHADAPDAFVRCVSEFLDSPKAGSL